ncbi:cytokine-like nuclear factor N-PAC isoform X1 [Lepeophtheirus salmonis]|uniref:Cytokine-like nuclear factor N-PAC n=1 Tax=Lepeophtheirus salmonis TaxID=72036 RepID=A0A0K2TU36_LEPSM|nr:putative oxidoreductase GLYR1 homolog isoform X1 [Lepeophtheirus salmonis]
MMNSSNTSSNEYTFRFGDPVWAKMKGFSAWPGKIDMPPDGMKRPAMRKIMHCVFFFGTHDFGWILDSDLKPYQEFKKALTSNKKSNSFLKAINEIEEFIANGGKSSVLPQDDEEEDTIDEEAEEKDAEFDALFNKKKTKVPKKRMSSLSSKTDSSKKPRLKPSNGKKSNRSFDPSLEERDFSLPPLSNHTPKKSASAAVSSFLDRPSALQRPASPSFDVTTSSQTLKEKDIQPSTLKFGFLGLGIMGAGIVKNLLNSGHHVSVWNRTSEKCEEFVKVGALKALTPADVILDSDITFSCVSDPQAAKDMVFGNCGVLTEISSTKAYVEMTGIDADTSQDIAEAICLKGGRYLEAQVQGSKQQSNDGTLVILAAGDRTLFDDCQSCFQAMGKNSFYLGEVGTASKMNLVLQLMAGVTLAGLAEGMALADRAGLQQRDVLEVLELTGLSCPLIIGKGKAIIEGGFPTNHPLQHMQKDLKLSLNMGDQLEQPLPLTASANEVFKHAKRLGYGDHDTSAVYIRARF